MHFCPERLIQLRTSLNINKEEKIHIQIQNHIKKEIDKGILKKGSKLPSTREVSKVLGISRNSVILAYENLENEGIIETFRGKGTFVAIEKEIKSDDFKVKWNNFIEDYGRLCEELDVVKTELPWKRGMISFKSIAPDESFFDLEEFKRAFLNVFSIEGDKLLNYGYAKGYRPLIEYIKEYMRKKGVLTDGKDILITNGFTEAFNIKAVGFGFLSTLIIGIQRGIFSNEAGLGTGSITSSTSSTDSPVSQGYIQMLGIYVTTLLICTATAIIVMTSNYDTLTFMDINGIELTQNAFRYHLGSFGDILLFVSILLFSFTTILTGYYDGESSLKYFCDKISMKYLIMLKIISLMVLFLGCVLSSTAIWTFVDIFTALLALINIYALFKLKKDVLYELNHYNNKKL